MSEIALYNILKRIEGVSDDEIEKVKEGHDKGWVTSLDLANLKIELIDRIAEQERRLIKHIYGAFGMALVGVGLMIKFL